METPPPSQAKTFWQKWKIPFLAITAIIVVAGIVNQPKTEKVYGKDVIAFRDSALIPMNAERFRTEMKQSEGKPVLLMIYASWCPYCKEQMKILKALRMRFPPEDVTIIYLAQDQDLLALSEFLMERKETDPLTPFYLTLGTDPEAKKTFIAEMGLGDRASVPHLAVFDRKRAIAYESFGLTETAVLVDALKKQF